MKIVKNNALLVLVKIVEMQKQLKWWRDLTKEQRVEIMKSNNIDAVTFEDIKRFYFENTEN